MMKRVHLSNTKKLFDFPDHFRVTSKWGSGLLYKHEIFDTPANYGEPRYFEEIQPSVAKTRFLEYARGKGVPDAILAD